MKHVNGPSCPRCDDLLKRGHPSLAKHLNELKKTFPDLHTSCVWRGEKDQNKAVAERKSRTPWPKSKHNGMRDGKPFALAMDLFRIGVDGKAYFNRDFYLEVANLSQILRMDLEWGGDWKKFPDCPHFQMKEKA